MFRMLITKMILLTITPFAHAQLKGLIYFSAGKEGLDPFMAFYGDGKFVPLLPVSNDSYENFKKQRESALIHFTEGAGLGLAIVKEIAERHGGKVWVDPPKTKGATFYLSISKRLWAFKITDQVKKFTVPGSRLEKDEDERNWKMKFICFFLTFTFFLCIGSHCFGSPNIRSCTDNLYPFLSAYFCSGHMEFIDDNHIKLNLKADSHFCDGGAPDCFGTYIEVHFYLSAIPGKCILKSVSVKLEDYNHCVNGEIDEKIELKPCKLSSGEINLYNPNLFKIEFRNDENQKGIILERKNFTYYSKFPPNAVLSEFKKDCEGDNPSPVDIVTQSNGFFELLE